jgi:hypothetical protein
MTYALAIQLKEAGFPQQTDSCDVCNDQEATCRIAEENRKKVLFPTLSELIAACGDGFRALKNNVDEWIAYGDEDIKPQICIQYDFVA